MSFRQVVAVAPFAPLLALGGTPTAYERWRTHQADIEPILEKTVTNATRPEAGGYGKNGCMMGACQHLVGDIELGPTLHQASPVPACGGLPARLSPLSRWRTAGAPYSEQDVGTIKARIAQKARD